MHTVWKTAFLATLPVLTGYLVLGFGFGIILKAAGLPLILAPAMSLAFDYGSAGAHKSLTTLACKCIRPIDKVFQASFFEHIICGDHDYKEIAQYINENPSMWELDRLYMEQ